MKFMFYCVPHAVISPSLLASTKKHAECSVLKTNPLPGQSTEQNQLNKLLHVFFI